MPVVQRGQKIAVIEVKEVIVYKFYNKVVSMLIKDWNGKTSQIQVPHMFLDILNASQFYALYGATFLFRGNLS